MDDRKEAAKRLHEQYSKQMVERGGDLEVRAGGRFLSAAVTWTISRIYDHVDIELDERAGFFKWRPVRPLDEAERLVEAQIQKWLRAGPPNPL